jgi:hypothetical protein
MANAHVTVTTTPTLLVAADPHDQTAIIHVESGAIFVGNASVTTSNGFKLDNNNKITFPIGAYEALYAVTNTGTSTAYIYSVVN